MQALCKEHVHYGALNAEYLLHGHYGNSRLWEGRRLNVVFNIQKRRAI